jgi:hypothetical protein
MRRALLIVPVSGNRREGKGGPGWSDRLIETRWGRRSFLRFTRRVGLGAFVLKRWRSIAGNSREMSMFQLTPRLSQRRSHQSAAVLYMYAAAPLSVAIASCDKRLLVGIHAHLDQGTSYPQRALGPSVKQSQRSHAADYMHVRSHARILPCFDGQCGRMC